MTTKTYLILSHKPSSKYDWEKLNLRDPLTYQHPDFTNLIADAIGNPPGEHLISVQISVEVLNSEPLKEAIAPATPEAPEASSSTDTSETSPVAA